MRAWKRNRRCHLIDTINEMTPVSELVQIDLSPRKPQPKPAWLKAKAPMGETFHNLKKMARELNLHTVCESAQCPNIGECWNQKAATFMMLGNLCTRRCGFCAVPKGRPEPIDFDEPRRVAYAVAQLGLHHAVDHPRRAPGDGESNRVEGNGHQRAQTGVDQVSRGHVAPI